MEIPAKINFLVRLLGLITGLLLPTVSFPQTTFTALGTFSDNSSTPLAGSVSINTQTGAIEGFNFSIPTMILGGTLLPGADFTPNTATANFSSIGSPCSPSQGAFITFQLFNAPSNSEELYLLIPQSSLISYSGGALLQQVTCGVQAFHTGYQSGLQSNPFIEISGNGAFTSTTSITQTLEPGVQAVYSFDNNANKYKITSSQYSTGGESLTISEVPILKSNFVPPANFPNETCIPVANFTALNGTDTCVEYQADCSFNGNPGGGDCNTLLYTLLESYDLPPDLPAIGGPDFLVVHGSRCPTSGSALAESIFTDYYVTRIDPTTKARSGGTASCFEVTYTPDAPLITSGGTSRFVGWQSPVSDSDLNQVKAGAIRPLIFNWNDNAGHPITNLSYCNMFITTNSGGICQDSPTVKPPWVNLSSFGVVCPSGAPINPTTDTTDLSTSGNSGFQNNGSGNYQVNWRTNKHWTGSCANVQVTFDNGVTQIPTTIGFQFN